MNRNKGGKPPDVGSNLLSFVSPVGERRPGTGLLDRVTGDRRSPLPGFRKGPGGTGETAGRAPNARPMAR